MIRQAVVVSHPSLGRKSLECGPANCQLKKGASEAQQRAIFVAESEVWRVEPAIQCRTDLQKERTYVNSDNGIHSCP
jgi:hypothetical protein